MKILVDVPEGSVLHIDTVSQGGLSDKTSMVLARSITSCNGAQIEVPLPPKEIQEDGRSLYLQIYLTQDERVSPEATALPQREVLLEQQVAMLREALTAAWSEDFHLHPHYCGQLRDGAMNATEATAAMFVERIRQDERKAQEGHWLAEIQALREYALTIEQMVCPAGSISMDGGERLTHILQSIKLGIPTAILGAQKQGEHRILDAIGQQFGVGEASRTMKVLSRNVENAISFSEKLHAVERDFFTVQVPDSEEGGTVPECLVNSRGSSTPEYLNQVREALSKMKSFSHGEGYAMGVMAGRKLNVQYEEAVSHFLRAVGRLQNSEDESVSIHNKEFSHTFLDRLVTVRYSPEEIRSATEYLRSQEHQLDCQGFVFNPAWTDTDIVMVALQMEWGEK